LETIRLGGFTESETIFSHHRRTDEKNYEETKEGLLHGA